MTDTSKQAPRSSESTPTVKLSRMLQSTLRRFPKAKLARTREGFGVSLDGGRWLHIRFSGDWTSEDLRDCLALFATWLVADPERLVGVVPDRSGVSVEVQTQYEPSSMPLTYLSTR